MKLKVWLIALEPEVQTTLPLPGRTAVPAPEHGTGAGVDAHGGVSEIEGGVVNPHLHQGTVIGAAVDAVAVLVS